MNLKALAGHTIDVLKVSENSVMLDVGCRGFDFTREFKDRFPTSRILAMDPGVEFSECHIPCKFIKAALVGNSRPRARYASYSTGEGNFITELDSYYDATFSTVPCMDIVRLMEFYEVDWFDVVKLDCEGSEFGILENWPGPIATQISVEFHDSGYTPGYGPDYDYGPMFERLKGFGYRITQHELSKQGAGTGHWDSLLVLGS